MNYQTMGGTIAAISILVSAATLADGVSLGHDGLNVLRADAHAPIGVMGDHMHKRGEWMLSYRYMYMSMEGNRIKDEEVGSDTIVTTIPNRFFGAPMQPPTLRVVPTEMTMDMHMFGLMYAPSDWLTLMLMSGYVEKEMDHTTYRGGAGTTVLGTFTTKSNGFGDTRLGAMVRVYSDGTHHVHVNLGATIPTGTTSAEDTILTPMGTAPTLRLPYAMQLGSGTVDLLPGITYTGHRNRLGWGAQYAGTVRTGDDNGYSWGNRHEMTGWLSYQPFPNVSGSVRIRYQAMDSIEGIDPKIVAPVQTADPDHYGGDIVNLLLGLNWSGHSGWLKGKRIALEAGFPILRDLNGPQLETDFTLTGGLQVAF